MAEKSASSQDPGKIADSENTDAAAGATPGATAGTVTGTAPATASSSDAKTETTAAAVTAAGGKSSTETSASSAAATASVEAQDAKDDGKHPLHAIQPHAGITPEGVIEIQLEVQFAHSFSVFFTVCSGSEEQRCGWR